MDVHYSQLIWIISILLTCYVGFFFVCLFVTKFIWAF